MTLSAVGLAVGERPAPALPDEHSANMVHLTNVRDEMTEDKSRALWSDSAFWGSTMAVFDGNVGSESGFRTLDISTPSAPKLLHNVRRPGSTSHLALWDHLVILSAEADLNGRACPDDPADAAPSPDGCPVDEARPFSGLIVYDIRGSTPKKLVEQELCRGLGHNFTVLPDLEHLDGSGLPAPRLLLYVSGSPCQDEDEDDGLQAKTFLPVYELSLRSPTSLQRARHPKSDKPAGVDITGFIGAHDMTVFVPGKLAFVGDPLGGFLLFDITDPLNPVRRASVKLEGTDVLNVNANHSGAFSWDGKTLVVAEEAQGGAGATATDDESLGRLRFYDISDVAHPQLKSVYKVPASRASYVGPHSVHQVNVLPTKRVKGVRGNILSASWYRGGSSLVDFTDPADPREIAHYVFRNEAKPDGTVGIHSFTTASFWYNGFVYASNAPEDGIADALTTGREVGRSRGLDVFRVVDPLTGADLVHRTHRLGRMNYSTQEGPQGYADP